MFLWKAFWTGKYPSSKLIALDKYLILQPWTNQKTLLRKDCDSPCLLKCFCVCPSVETSLQKHNLLLAKQKCFLSNSETFHVCQVRFLLRKHCFLLPSLGNMAKHWQETMFPQQCFLVCPGLYFFMCAVNNFLLTSFVACVHMVFLNIYRTHKQIKLVQETFACLYDIHEQHLLINDPRYLLQCHR